MTQSPEIINGPATAPQGSTITIEVTGNASSVQVSTGGPDVTNHTVPANGRVSIPTPPGFTGILAISVGKGLRRRYLFVEIVSTGP